jgi:hypothetical protein
MAGDVAAGMRETCGKTGPYWVRAERPDNWDRRRCLVCDLRDLGPAIDDDNVHGQPDQLASHRGQSAEIPGSESILDRDVLPFDVAEITQSSACPASAPMRQKGRVEEGRISGPS